MPRWPRRSPKDRTGGRSTTTACSAASATHSADLHRLSFTLVAARAAEVVAELTELLGCGCRERARPDGLIDLDFWIGDLSPVDAAVAAVRRLDVSARHEVVAESYDWRARLREAHRPVTVGRLRLRPPWEDPLPGLLDIEIDPGMAFGTGQHATTRACLELLQARATGSVLDAGCGSGVLAIAARRLGHDPVIAVDDDPEAVRATRSNALRNRVGLRIARRRIGVDRLPAVDGVVANLTASMMEPLSGALGDGSPEWVILSGLRDFEAAGAAAVFARHDLREREVRGDGRWIALLLTR